MGGEGGNSAFTRTRTQNRGSPVGSSVINWKPICFSAFRCTSPHPRVHLGMHNALTNNGFRSCCTFGVHMSGRTFEFRIDPSDPTQSRFRVPPRGPGAWLQYTYPAPFWTCNRYRSAFGCVWKQLHIRCCIFGHRCRGHFQASRGCVLGTGFLYYPHGDTRILSARNQPGRATRNTSHLSL